MRKFRTAFVLAMCGLLCMPAAGASTSGGSDLAEAEFRQLERDIPSLYLLNGLYLSKDQSAELAGIVSRAGQVEQKFVSRFGRMLEDYRKDIERERKALVERVGRGEEVKMWDETASDGWRRLRQGRTRLEELRREKEEAMCEFSGKAVRALNDSQRDILLRFKPCFIPPGDFRNPERVGQAAGDVTAAERALSRLRKVRESGLADATEEALTKLVGLTLQERHVKYSKEAEELVRVEIESKLNEILPKVRAMSDADYELSKNEFARELLPVEKQAAGEVKMTTKERSEVEWKTTVYLLNTGIADVLRNRGDSPGGQNPVPPRPAPLIEEYRDAGSALRAASAIAGLKLSQEQAARLLQIVQETVRRKQTGGEEVRKAKADALANYRKLRAQLADGQPTEAAEKPAMQAHIAVKELVDEDLRKTLLKAEEEVDKLLGAEQIAWLATLKAGRPGPAKDKNALQSALDVGEVRQRAARLLSRASGMTDSQFERNKRSLCEEFVDSCIVACGAGYDEVNIDSETTRAVAVLEGARKLQQADYEREKDNIAAELCPRRTLPRDPTYGAKYHAGKPVQLSTGVSEALFNETAVAILERLAAKPRK